jgi:hypothetical protein
LPDRPSALASPTPRRIKPSARELGPACERACSTACCRADA